MNILISRTDAIGDVILTIPLSGYLKQKFPGCKVFFLGRTYTKAIIESAKYIDAFINWDEIIALSEKEQVAEIKALNIDWFLHIYPNKAVARLAKKAAVPNRVGTSHRTYHWLTCNKRVDFTRRNSDLHESQLNFKLLAPMGVHEIPVLKDIPFLYGMQPALISDKNLPVVVDPEKINVILHPKSKGSAREWGLENFGKLIELLPSEKFKVFISGTADDKANMGDWLNKYENQVEDITGKLSLDEFVHFITKADALVAASTGPLHIASAMGIKAIGIYPPIRPMHPGRWKPIGKKAEVLVLNKTCEDCRKSTECACMKAIKPEQVLRLLEV
jgi:ADP-heptose:LPS heptosyltransferase